MASDDIDAVLQRIFPQSALDALPQPMWIYGPDGVVAGCNVAAETFWLLPREHVVGKFNAYEHAAASQDPTYLLLTRALRSVFATGEVETCEPVLIDLANVDVVASVSRQQAYIENTIFPLRDAAGVVRFAAVMQRDITELVEKRQAIDQAMAKIAAQDVLISALEAAQHAIDEQRRTIEELSTPIIQVWEGVLTLPVVGVIDEGRAAEMMHKLLEEIVKTRAEFAIVDLTGVRSVDLTTAESLARILGAVTLLGARGILSGVSPVVAEALTAIEVDMTKFETCRDLSDALLRTMHARARTYARPRSRS